MLIKQNKNIKGVKINNKEFLISHNINSRWFRKIIKYFYRGFKIYAKISGWHVNIEKTNAVGIGSMKDNNRVQN